MKPDAALNQFLQQYLEDHERGVVRDSGHYRGLWPEHAELIGEEYERLQGRGPNEGGRQREVPAAWQRIDQYDVKRVVGQGGQGIVFEAWDEALQRRVALKVLTGLQSLSLHALERFKREAVLASRLDHPAVCTVYDAGNHEGQPYIAMRFVEGESLAQMLTRSRSLAKDVPGGESRSVDLERAAGSSGEARDPDGEESSSGSSGSRPSEIRRVVVMIERVARALHHAHEAGIVHRDIKPGNIMMTPEGRPVILDFGLARADEAEDLLVTGSGDVFGTPSYMSPEQVAGGRESITRRSDVYSLGATLFECLTLRRPFEEPTPEALFDAIRTSPAPDVRRLNPQVPRDLGVVVATCLHKAQERRYSTAEELADDLRRTLDREPIHARPAGPWLRARLWAQRHPAVAVLGSLLLITLLIATIWGLYFVQLLDGKRREAEQRGERLRWQGYRADVAAALGRLQLGDALAGRRFLEGAAPELRGWEWRHGRWLSDMSELTIAAHAGKGYFTPLAGDPGTLVSWGGPSRESRTVRYWDAATGRRLREIAGVPPGNVYPDVRGDQLVFCASDARRGTIALWDVKANRLRWSKFVDNILSSEASPSFSPDGTKIAVGVPRALLVFDASSGEVTTLPNDGVVFAPSFLDEERVLARLQIGARFIPAILDVTTGDTVDVLVDPPEGATLQSVQPCSDRRFALLSWRFRSASAGQLNRIGSARVPVTVVDMESRREVARFDAESRTCEWLPGRGVGVLARLDGSVQIVDAATQRVLGILRGHAQPARRVFTLQEGHRIASGTAFGEIRLWSPDVGSQPFEGISWVSQHSTVSPQGRWVACGHWGAVTLFDTDSGAPQWRRNLGRSDITAVSFGPRGERLAVGDGSGGLWILEVGTGEIAARVRGAAAARALTWSRDGEMLAAGGADGRLSTFDLPALQPRSFAVSDHPIETVCFAPGDARLWAATRRDAFILDIGSSARTEIPVKAQVTALTPAPNGQHMMTGDRAGRIVMRDAVSGDIVRSFAEVGDRVVALRHVDAGRRLAAATLRSVYMLDTETGDPVFDHACASLFTEDLGFREDTGALVLSGRRQAFQCLETGPPACGFGERESVRRALAWIGPLFDELDLAAEVLRRVGQADDREAEVVTRAGQFATRLGDAANELNSRAWSLVVDDESGASECQRALRCARRACEMMPDEHALLNTLGLALYRCGLWSECEATMTRCLALDGGAAAGARPVDLAIRSMARARLGRKAEALRDLSRAREVARDPRHAPDWSVRTFVEEAAELLEAPR